MNGFRGLPTALAVPVLGAVLLGTVLLLRHHDGTSQPIAERKTTSKPAEIMASAKSTTPVPPPHPASPTDVAPAVNEARFRSTYRNYRSAVAGGNDALREALRPVLLKDREAALKMASEELSRAGTAADREIAQKTLDTLRR